MTNTRENLIALLKAKYHIAHRVADIWKKEGNMQAYSEEIAIACVLQDVIYCLSDKQYFTDMVKIYEKDFLKELTK